ncbi:hypothetical protein R6Q59_032709 [Mikania micrantha]
MTRCCFMLVMALAVSVYTGNARDIPRENKDAFGLADQKNIYNFGGTGGFGGLGNNGLPMGGMGPGIGVGGDFGGHNGIGGVGARYQYGGPGGVGTFGGLGNGFGGLPTLGGGGLGGGPIVGGVGGVIPLP